MQYHYLKLSEPFRRYSSRDSIEKIEENEVVHGSYAGLLFDKRWRDKRLVILERDSNKCVLCKSKLSLQVHHRQYHFIKSTKAFTPPWEYPNELLITLCEKCHKKGHRQHKVPTIYI